MDAPKAPAPSQSVERYFLLSLLGLLASGYLAIASSGLLDGLAHAAALMALALRAAVIAGWLRVRPDNAVTGALAVTAVLFFPKDSRWGRKEPRSLLRRRSL